MEPTPGAFSGWKGPHHAGRRANDVSLTGWTLQGSWSLLVFAGLLRAERDRCPVLGAAWGQAHSLWSGQGASTRRICC